MCFAPQRRALFRHLNFQKWSENGVLCTFWLPNVLCATTACNFSCLIWPAGSAPAALASLLFDPPEPQIIGKNTIFRDFPTFSRICIFFLLSLSLLLFFLLIFLFSLPLPCSAFHLSTLSEVWLLNFLRWWVNGLNLNFNKSRRNWQTFEIIRRMFATFSETGMVLVAWFPTNWLLSHAGVSRAIFREWSTVRDCWRVLKIFQRNQMRNAWGPFFQATLEGGAERSFASSLVENINDHRTWTIQCDSLQNRRTSELKSLHHMTADQTSCKTS